MEVHHPSHTERKKWTHYFWEFLMLFLAVTLGFFVENQREHYVEHQREKQFMNSMIRDLAQDVLNAEINLERRVQTIDRCNAMFRQLNNPGYRDSTGLIYFNARNVSAYYNFFVLTDGTLQQLKNSGGFRLIRKRVVVDSIQAYENLVARFDRDQQLEQHQLSLYRDQMLKVFDVGVFETILQGSGAIAMPEGNPPLFSNEKSVFNDFLMRVHFLKRNNIMNYNSMFNIKERAKNLITLISREYNLK